MTQQLALLGEAVPILIDTVQGSTVSSAGVTTISVPAHADRDLIVAWGANRTATPSSTPSDSVGGVWNTLTSAVANTGSANDRSMTVASCRSDGQARTVTFAGPSASASVLPYSGCMIWRNARGIGSAQGANTFTGTGGATITAPALISLTQPPSVIMVFTYITAIASGPADWTIVDGMAYTQYARAWAGGSFGLSVTLLNISCSVELY